MKTRFTGLIAAPFTPFSKEGELNLSAIAPLAKQFRTQGLTGAFIAGTTGEGFSLTLAERQALAEEWMAHSAGLHIIVQAGHLALTEACALARHAARIGAAAIASTPPFYYRPATVDSLVRYCRRIADAAPELPFFYYHYPALTGVSLPLTEFLEGAAAQIPTFAGIKFSHDNLMEFRLCLDLADNRFDLLFGRDEMLLAGLALGATGAIGATYNFAAPLYHSMMEHFRNGRLREAQALQSNATRGIELLRSRQFLPAAKAVMNRCGVDCGPVRSPLESLSESAGAEVHARLREIGMIAGPHAG